jgi:N-acyl-phosphatidylethanolamine-hydrolysing phospholipase D
VGLAAVLLYWPVMRYFSRRTVRTTTAVAVTLASLAIAELVSLDTAAPASDQPAHHSARGFRNVDRRYSYSLAQRVVHVLRPIPGEARGRPLEVVATDVAALRAPAATTVTWVGHSTFLVQLGGINVLTDPNWSDRTSPVPFAGPRRLVPPGLRFEDLPRIHAVVVSHDHYDHLDRNTVMRLAREHHPTFFVPLGLKAWFAENGIDNVVELDWWESRAFGPLTFTCTPAQHSSGRSLALADQNLRLWSSWVIADAHKRFFFGGDTGYYPGLAEIGRRLGPFDIAALPIGGYSDYHGGHPNHLSPEEALQAFEDLNATLMVPMHWGTFSLNREPFAEPPRRLLAEALRRGDEERVALLSPGQTIRW